MLTGEYIPCISHISANSAIISVAPAIATNYSRAGVVINFVTATGGDVEMLRSIECFYKIKCVSPVYIPKAVGVLTTFLSPRCP